MIRLINTWKAGPYKRKVFINRRWVKWVGFAALPIAGRWYGLALQIRTKPPQGKRYKIQYQDGASYPISYNPETRKPTDE